MFNMKVPLIATFFWSAITCTFLAVIGYGMLNQTRALWYPSAVGTVDSIQQTVSHGRSTTYGIDIAYHYTVDGQQYNSTRLRYMQPSTSGNWTGPILRQFPAGSHPPVYYDPRDPGESVLIRGVEGMDLTMALFLTPFTLVMVMMWVSTILRLRKTKGFLGLRVREENSITRIRPSGWMALGAGAMTLGVGSFVSIFILLIGFGFHSSLPVAETVWGLLLGTTCVVGLFKFTRIRSGAEDVVLDDASSTLTAPKHMNVPYSTITGVHVLTKLQTCNKGQATYKYEVWLHYTPAGGAVGKLKLESWTDQEEEARRFAAWLALRVNVPVGDGTATPASQ